MKLLQLIILIIIISISSLKSQKTDFEKILTGHGSTVLCLDLDSRGKYLCSGSYDTDVILWDYESGELLKKYSKHSAAIRKIKVSPDNKYIACGSVDNNINARGSTINCLSLLDSESFELLESLSIEPDRYKRFGFIPELDDSTANGVSKISFNSNSNKLAVVTKRGDLFIWDLKNGYTRSDWWFGNTKHKLLNISPEWNYVVCSERKRRMVDSCFYFMSMDENEIVAIFDNPRKTVTGVYFSNDLKTVASIGGNRIKRNEIYLWDIETTKLKHTLISHDNVIRSIDFSGNDKYLASVGEDNLINLWNAVTGKLIVTITEDNNMELTSVLFSHDDNYLVTGSQDMTIKYWNISNLISNY
jgi:WD40 repeat protein